MLPPREIISPSAQQNFLIQVGKAILESSGQGSRFIRLGGRPTPRLQVDPPQQVVEAGVVADGVEPGVYVSPTNTVIAFINGFGKPFDG